MEGGRRKERMIRKGCEVGHWVHLRTGLCVGVVSSPNDKAFNGAVTAVGSTGLGTADGDIECG